MMGGFAVERLVEGSMGRGNKLWLMEGSGIMKGRRSWKWD